MGGASDTNDVSNHVSEHRRRRRRPVETGKVLRGSPLTVRRIQRRVLPASGGEDVCEEKTTGYFDPEPFSAHFSSSFHLNGSRKEPEGRRRRLTVTDIREVLVETGLHVLLKDASGEQSREEEDGEREEPIPRTRRSRSGSRRRFN